MPVGRRFVAFVGIGEVCDPRAVVRRISAARDASPLRLALIPQITAAIITHAHSDHYLGLDDLGSVVHDAGWLHEDLLPIYATPDNWSRIEATFSSSVVSSATRTW